jgi:hypothetical protein
LPYVTKTPKTASVMINATVRAPGAPTSPPCGWECAGAATYANYFSPSKDQTPAPEAVEELAEVLEDLGFVRVGGTHADVSVRSDDEQGVAVDAVVQVGVALVVGEVGHARFAGG